MKCTLDGGERRTKKLPLSRRTKKERKCNFVARGDMFKNVLLAC